MLTAFAYNTHPDVEGIDPTNKMFMALWKKKMVGLSSPAIGTARVANPKEKGFSSNLLHS